MKKNLIAVAAVVAAMVTTITAADIAVFVSATDDYDLNHDGQVDEGDLNRLEELLVGSTPTTYRVIDAVRLKKQLLNQERALERECDWTSEEKLPQTDEDTGADIDKPYMAYNIEKLSPDKGERLIQTIFGSEGEFELSVENDGITFEDESYIVNFQMEVDNVNDYNAESIVIMTTPTVGPTVVVYKNEDGNLVATTKLEADIDKPYMAYNIEKLSPDKGERLIQNILGSEGEFELAVGNDGITFEGESYIVNFQMEVDNVNDYNAESIVIMTTPTVGPTVVVYKDEDGKLVATTKIE